MSIITSLRLQDWRNFTEFESSLNEGINYLVGDNGVGKTSVVEAIYYLAHRKSWRTNHPRELIRRGQLGSYLTFTIEDKKYVLKLTRGESIQLSVDGKIQTNAAILNKLLPVLLFTFDDLQIIQGAPQFRRELLDTTISLVDQEYRKLLVDYKKVLRTRTGVLHALKKGVVSSPNLIDSNALVDNASSNTLDSTVEPFTNRHSPATNNSAVLTDITYQLMVIGTKIMLKRLEFFPQIEPLVNRYYNYFLGEASQVNLLYQPSFMLKGLSAAEIYDQFDKSIKYEQNVEIHSGHNLFGPHRDDFGILFNHESTKHFFSLGEQWSMALSFKLVQAELIKHQKPLLIFDDVFAIIDQKRSLKLVEILQESPQVFITTHQLSKDLSDNQKVIQL
ncbi:MAG: AAA family ATPase [Bifidobacteriaceae bacterium]|jgi:DNA replication and repair protein RecF|nr:AAA family ATPase [Bifidobacteriaceae bacterium]